MKMILETIKKAVKWYMKQYCGFYEPFIEKGGTMWFA